MLDKVNKVVIESTKLTPWKNTDTVIGWFKNIEIKEKRLLLYLTLKVFTFYITRVIQQEHRLRKFHSQYIQ